MREQMSGPRAAQARQILAEAARGFVEMARERQRLLREMRTARCPYTRRAAEVRASVLADKLHFEFPIVERALQGLSRHAAHPWAAQELWMIAVRARADVVDAEAR